MSQSIMQRQKQSSNEAPGAQVQRWAEWLDQKFQEREVTTRLALLAVCARQHLLLLGPPGTAKTLLTRQVTDAVQGRWFTTLLTKFSAPEDVFGPLSLPRLEQGVYERLTTGYLPSADVAFLDEIYKANASILNALLSILNERVYFNGNQQVELALRSVIAASNEVPDAEDGLEALDDRLLLRACVDHVAETSAFVAMLKARDSGSSPAPLPPSMLRELDAAASRIGIGDTVLKGLCLAREKVRALHLQVSDRRWKQIVGVMQVMAALDGCEEVEIAHLGVLRHTLWRRPADQAKVVQVLAHVLDHLPDPTTTATRQELVAMLAQQAQAFSACEQELRQRHYGYVYHARENELHGKLREALHKAAKIIDAARSWSTTRLGRVASPLGLWDAFWRELPPSPEIEQGIRTLREHTLITQQLRHDQYEALASEWNARVRS
jgi:MoxR-like ATPase